MIFIVIKNGEVDEVFSNREAAELHRKNLQKKWSITKIIEREVNYL